LRPHRPGTLPPARAVMRKADIESRPRIRAVAIKIACSRVPRGLEGNRLSLSGPILIIGSDHASPLAIKSKNHATARPVTECDGWWAQVRGIQKGRVGRGHPDWLPCSADDGRWCCCQGAAACHANRAVLWWQGASAAMPAWPVYCLLTKW
jgi:hypothetical protein